MSAHVSPIREPLIEGSKSYHDITEDLIGPSEKAPNLAWIIALSVALGCLTFGIIAICWTIWFGIGSWDLNRTIGWGWDITNFVWWIGIGHAGTLISAILLLFRQKWRTGVNRAAEAMTIFAVYVRWSFPSIAHGAPLLGFLYVPLSQYQRSSLGKLQLSTALGFICDQYLLYGITFILVYRSWFLILLHERSLKRYPQKDL